MQKSKGGRLRRYATAPTSQIFYVNDVKYVCCQLIYHERQPAIMGVSR